MPFEKLCNSFVGQFFVSSAAKVLKQSPGAFRKQAKPLEKKAKPLEWNQRDSNPIGSNHTEAHQLEANKLKPIPMYDVSSSQVKFACSDVLPNGACLHHV